MEDFKAAFKIYSDGSDLLTADQLSKVLTRAGKLFGSHRFTTLLHSLTLSLGVRGNADKMLNEAQPGGDKDGIDFLTFQTMMSRKLASVSAQAGTQFNLPG